MVARTRFRCSLVIAVALAVGCDVAPAQGPAQRSPTPQATTGSLRIDTVATGLVNPWALAFLPDGRIVVTERPGRLRIVARDGSLSEPVSGVPAVHAEGQGGLLDVAIDPAFARNGLVYLSFAERGEGGEGTAVARGRLVGNALQEVTTIYRQQPKLRGGGHFGSRLVFSRDGLLYVTQGDRMGWRERAQDLTQGMGKVMRIRPDGSIPADNPFVSRAGAQPAIWSYGHRNVQAAALHPETGALWTVEHGARGGDELNRPEAGKNYGWPVITYGRDYSGMKIGEGVEKAEMEQPVYYWDPVIAPSGITFYTGDAFRGWKGNVLIGSLGTVSLVRLVMQDGRVASEHRYQVGERVRDVAQGPDGFVYIVTDNANGKLLRLRPM